MNKHKKLQHKINYISSVCMLILSTGCSIDFRKDPSELKECTHQEAYQKFTSLGNRIYENHPLQCTVEDEDYYYIEDIDALVEFYRVYGVMGSRTDYLWFQSKMDIDEIVDRLNEVIPARFRFSMQSDKGKTEVTLEIKDERYQGALSKAQQVATDIQMMTTDYNMQMLLAHDYIISQTVYVKGQEGIDEASSVFLDGKANCSGYSRAYMMLLQQLQIPAMYISSSEMNHAWNLVYDGKDYWYIDTTFDDNINIEPYYYVNSNLESFLRDHELDPTKDSKIYVNRMNQLYKLPAE